MTCPLAFSAKGLHRDPTIQLPLLLADLTRVRAQCGDSGDSLIEGPLSPRLTGCQAFGSRSLAPVFLCSTLSHSWVSNCGHRRWWRGLGGPGRREIFIIKERKRKKVGRPRRVSESQGGRVVPVTQPRGHSHKAFYIRQASNCPGQKACTGNKNLTSEKPGNTHKFHGTSQCSVTVCMCQETNSSCLDADSHLPTVPTLNTSSGCHLL